MCGRRESNPHEPFGSTDFRTVCGFRRPGAALDSASPGFAVWTIPSPSPGEFRGLGATRLVSTPSTGGVPRRGLARDFHCRVPRIWAVLHRRFPGKHSSFFSSPLRLPFRHARVNWLVIFYHKWA